MVNCLLNGKFKIKQRDFVFIDRRFAAKNKTKNVHKDWQTSKTP